MTPGDSLTPLSPRLALPDAQIPERFRALESRRDVAALLEIPESYLVRILYRRREPTKYIQFEIAKRNGGMRGIAAPPAALKILQAKLNHVFQAVYAPRRSVHGFVRQRSILTNALEHVNKRWVLNIDLLDFFPRINFGRVRGMLMARPYGLGERAATVIAQICCWDGGLPQGAPSSPMLANMVCGRLDGELFALARRHRVTYTRYADDITFSSRKHSFPEALAVETTDWVGKKVMLGEALERVVRENGFEINRDKSRLQFRDCHQEVTGLVVNQFANVPRRRVREVRAMLHAWRKYGLPAAEEEFRRRAPTSSDSSFRHVIRGRLEFIGAVRGFQDPTYCRLREQLHALDGTLIAAAPTPIARVPIKTRGIGTDPGWTRWFRAMQQKVVQLEIRKPGAAVSAGTAFAFRPSFFATVAHNLEGEVRLRLGDQAVAVVEAIPHGAYQRGVDLALFKNPTYVEPIEVASTLPLPGERIAVIGYASVPRRHAGAGIYVGAVESINTDYYGVTYIQLAVDGAGGLSGSPVINTEGRVIGVFTEATFEQTEAGVPSRQFFGALPVAYMLEIDRNAQHLPLPLSLSAAGSPRIATGE